jgi:hypothetical protein
MVRTITFAVGLLMSLLAARDASAHPISFTFGMSSDITVPANERVDLPAVLINTGTDPIAFGCVGCGGLRFGMGIGSESPEGLDPLNIEFPPLTQFQNVTIPVGQQFSFVFTSIAFDPSETTVLLALFVFSINQPGGLVIAKIPATIIIGAELQFGPLSFAPSRFSPQPPHAPTPEPATFLMLVSVGAAAGLARARRALKRPRVR